LRKHIRTMRLVECPVIATAYHCDGCGKMISREDHGNGYAHDLQIWLDGEECVGFFRERDYCPACLDPIWREISRLIKADPEAEREDGREYE
jgi:hypothetical protein